jgi:5-hydroxyisourate hydrolase
MTDGPTISTHVLDLEHGQPAAGVGVRLYRVDADEREVGRGTTDADGRIRRLLDGDLEAGDYELRFDLDGTFFLGMVCSFRIQDTLRSYHVPLLLSSYSLSIYRGS